MPGPYLAVRPKTWAPQALAAVRAMSSLDVVRQPEYTARPVAKLVKTKRRCCKSGPRCKRCPVVCKRLEKQGLAERLELRLYKVSGTVSKKQLKAARAR
jgi:hypothetical protein